MSWDIGCSRNIFLSLRVKSKVFHVRLHYEFKRYSYTVLEAQNFPKLENLDIESQISEYKWVIHNGLRRTSLIYRSDKQQVTISQHRWNGYQWSFLTNIELKKKRKLALTWMKERKADGYCHSCQHIQLLRKHPFNVSRK